MCQQTAEYLVPCSTQSQFPYLWSAALHCTHGMAISSALTRGQSHSSLSHKAGGTVVRGAAVCLMGLEPRGGKDVLKVTKGKLSL